MKHFNEIYENLYTENYTQLKALRNKERKMQLLIAVIIFALYLYICVLFPNLIFLGFILYVMVIFIVFNAFRNQKYVFYYKKNIINSLIKNYNDTFIYSPKLGVSSSIYLEGEFEQHFDRYYSEDSINGMIQELCPFKMGEVRTQIETCDEDGHTSYTTSFNGLFAKIEFPTFVPCTIKIRKNAFMKTISQSVSTSRIHPTSIVKRLEMDSNEFEKLYDVYSDNHIVTMQLFTSDIMQMLLDFKTNYKIFPEITIKQNSLYLRFSLKKQLFEPKLFKKVLDYNEIQDCYIFINSIMDLCNVFLKNILDIEF